MFYKQTKLMKQVRNFLLLALTTAIFISFFSFQANKQKQTTTFISSYQIGQESLTLKRNQIYIHYQGVSSEEVQKMLSQNFPTLKRFSGQAELQQQVVFFDSELAESALFELIYEVNKKFENIYATPMFDDGFSGFVTYDNRLLVKLNNESSKNDVEEVVKGLGLRIKGYSRFDESLLLVEVPNDLLGQIMELTRVLEDNEGTQYAQPNYIRTAYLDNDPYYDQLWYLNNTGQDFTFSNACDNNSTGNEHNFQAVPGADIDAENAWAVEAASSIDNAPLTGNANGNAIKVAVLDTGVDMDHPDLQQNIGPGFDAVWETFQDNDEFEGGQDLGGDTEGSSHGTSCAGIIAAVENNGIGTKGIAFNSQILPIRLLAPSPIGNMNTLVCNNSDGPYITTTSLAFVASDFTLIAAIGWGLEQGVDIFSGSITLGGLPSNGLNQTIIAATNDGRDGKGALFFFSAGNYNLNTVNYPGGYSHAIAVGATSVDDKRKRSLSLDDSEDNPVCCILTPTEFDDEGNPIDGEYRWGSNYGTGLDLMAPGVQIVAPSVTPDGDMQGLYNESFNGTSAACPIAAGVMALVLDANPNLNYEQARYAIESTCEKVNNGTGGYTYNENVSGQPNSSWSTQAGYGRVNAFNVVNEVNTATCSAQTDILTEDSGTLHDGSRTATYDYNYNINQHCSWLIEPAAAGMITLDFTSFDLALDDVLYVYESTDDSGPVSVYYQGFMPSVEVFFSSALYIEFITDSNPNGGQGWELSYTSTPDLTGTNCLEPVILECGSVYSSTNVGGGDAFDQYSNCISWNESGPERYHLVTVNTTGELTAGLSNLQDDLDVFILDACDPSNCIAHGNYTASANVAPGEYFILVDGYAGNTSNYTLSVSCDDAGNGALDCNSVVDISCGDPYTGSTLNGLNNVENYGCGAGTFSGAEDIYRFTLDQVEPVSISLSNATSSTELFLLDACDANSCVIAGGQGIDLPGLTPGTYYIVVDAPASSGGYYDLLVNCGVGAADLTWKAPNTLNINGTEVSGVATISNLSCSSTAGSTTVRFLISRDANFTDDDNYTVNTYSIPSLAPDASHTINFSMDIDDANPSAGSYYLAYIIDEADNVDEADEFNNLFYWSGLDKRILIQNGNYPNLTIVHGLSTLEVTGTYFEKTIEVYNTESITAGASYVAFYLSTNTDISTSDYFLEDVYVPVLGAGETYSVEIAMDVLDVIPNLPEDLYHIGFIIDYNNDVSESSGDDNEWYWPDASTNIIISYQDNCDGFTYLTESSGSISDGSGGVAYEDDTYCQWLIEPSEPTSTITLDFEEFQTESCCDHIYIYDGTSIEAPFLAELDGSSLPGSVTAYSGQMLVRFDTDGSVTGSGWSANYSSVPKSFCNGESELTNLSGVVSDGSECQNYYNNADCSWWINPGVAGSQIILSFDEFDLETNTDLLQVFDGDDENAPLLATLSGSNFMPNPITSSGESLYLRFTSNESGRFEGFNASYITTQGTGSIAGTIMREDSAPIEGTTVHCSAINPMITQDDGQYLFENLPGGQSYTIDPERNYDWKEGVNVLDRVAVQMHVLGIASLNSPYKIISADVNHSESVSTLDGTLIWQLLLGNITEFPNNESWRFIPASYQFPEPENPWSNFFPEYLQFNDLSSDFDFQDFIGTKIGDVNLEATGDGVIGSGDERADDLVFILPAKNVKKGMPYELSFKAKDFESILAFQTNLSFDPSDLEFQELQTGMLPGFDENCVGVKQLASGKIALVWNSTMWELGETLDKGTTLFTLKFVAKRDLPAHYIPLKITEDRIQSIAYNRLHQNKKLVLEWDASSSVHNLSNHPNPFKQETLLSFQLENEGEIRIRIFSLTGSLLHQIDQHLEAGHQQITLGHELFPVSATYLCELEMEGEKSIIHLIHQK